MGNNSSNRSPGVAPGELAGKKKPGRLKKWRSANLPKPSTATAVDLAAPTTAGDPLPPPHSMSTSLILTSTATGAPPGVDDDEDDSHYRTPLGSGASLLGCGDGGSAGHKTSMVDASQTSPELLSDGGTANVAFVSTEPPPKSAQPLTADNAQTVAVEPRKPSVLKKRPSQTEEHRPLSTSIPIEPRDGTTGVDHSPTTSEQQHPPTGPASQSGTGGSPPVGSLTSSAGGRSSSRVTFDLPPPTPTRENTDEGAATASTAPTTRRLSDDDDFEHYFLPAESSIEFSTVVSQRPIQSPSPRPPEAATSTPRPADESVLPPPVADQSASVDASVPVPPPQLRQSYSPTPPPRPDATTGGIVAKTYPSPPPLLLSVVDRATLEGGVGPGDSLRGGSARRSPSPRAPADVVVVPSSQQSSPAPPLSLSKKRSTSSIGVGAASSMWSSVSAPNVDADYGGGGGATAAMRGDRRSDDDDPRDRPPPVGSSKAMRSSSLLVPGCSSTSDAASTSGSIVSGGQPASSPQSRRQSLAVRRQSNAVLASKMTTGRGRRGSMTTLVPLTAGQIHIVRNVWRQIYASKGPAGLGSAVFQKLFFKLPAARDTFRNVKLPSDKYSNRDAFMKVHCRQLGEMFDNVVANLECLEDVGAALEEVGRKHADLGSSTINAKFWNVMAESFIDCTLEWGDKRSRTENARKAWALVVAFIIEKIKAGHLEEKRSLQWDANEGLF